MLLPRVDWGGTQGGVATSYCAPAMRKADIEAINAQYVFGGDHDPILTAARQPYFDYIASLDPPEATETPAP